MYGEVAEVVSDFQLVVDDDGFAVLVAAAV